MNTGTTFRDAQTPPRTGNAPLVRLIRSWLDRDRERLYASARQYEREGLIRIAETLGVSREDVR